MSFSSEPEAREWRIDYEIEEEDALAQLDAFTRLHHLRKFSQAHELYNTCLIYYENWFPILADRQAEDLTKDEGDKRLFTLMGILADLHRGVQYPSGSMDALPNFAFQDDPEMPNDVEMHCFDIFLQINVMNEFMNRPTNRLMNRQVVTTSFSTDVLNQQNFRDILLLLVAQQKFWDASRINLLETLIAKCLPLYIHNEPARVALSLTIQKCLQVIIDKKLYSTPVWNDIERLKILIPYPKQAESEFKNILKDAVILCEKSDPDLAKPQNIELDKDFIFQQRYYLRRVNRLLEIKLGQELHSKSRRFARFGIKETEKRGSESKAAKMQNLENQAPDNLFELPNMYTRTPMETEIFLRRLWHTDNHIPREAHGGTRTPGESSTKLLNMINKPETIIQEVLGHAYFGNESEIVRLLDGGCNINLHHGRTLHTSLHLAAANGKENVVRVLLERGADISANDWLNWMPIHHAAANEHEFTLKLLLEKGANVNEPDWLHLMPIHYAAMNGYESIVALLLERRADIYAKDVLYWTPIHHAAANGHESVVILLLERGADINIKDETGYTGQTPLHFAAKYGHESIIALLLEKGADINTRNKTGQTPLHYAAISGHESVVALLLERGADINAQNGPGYKTTPMHYAAMNGYESIVALLLEKGADINAKDEAGQTPLYYAHQNEFESIPALLLKKEAELNMKG